MPGEWAAPQESSALSVFSSHWRGASPSWVPPRPPTTTICAYALSHRRADAVYEPVGQGDLPLSISLRGGVTDRIVTIADPGAADLGVGFVAGGFGSATALADHALLATDGRLRIRIAASLPLAEAARARAGHRPGKGKPAHGVPRRGRASRCRP
jgi:hypothetical protein